MAWITITGPESGAPAIVEADPAPCWNTIEIASSSYVAIEHLTIDGRNVDGAFGISAHVGVVHDIRIEANEIVNHHGSQQHDAISTKVTWGWVIRNNRIRNAGTGLYLGDSEGQRSVHRRPFEDVSYKLAAVREPRKSKRRRIPSRALPSEHARRYCARVTGAPRTRLGPTSRPRRA